MIIKDVKGKYTLEVDATRRICYETPIGLWDKDDYERYHNDYVSKVAPQFTGKKWAVCTDLKNYKTSNISDAMGAHAEWAAKNGLSCGAFIVESAVVKMQMNRATTGKLTQQAFTDLNEAKEWLKSQGY
jgi:hypothetical protein